MADAERLAEIMQALASPVRLRILSALSVQPSTVTELSDQLHIGQTTTSNHLRLPSAKSPRSREIQGRLRRRIVSPGNVSSACESGVNNT